MKLRLCSGVVSSALVLSAGCDVRTGPVPEVAPIVGAPEQKATRARPATRESLDALDVRDRQSRIDDSAAAGAAAAGTSSRSNSRTTPPVAGRSDASLAFEVQSALAAEPSLRGSAIDVRSENGIVTLRGTARDAENRMLAALVARAVQGVRVVRNELAAPGEA